jgi:hypothetical protein
MKLNRQWVGRGAVLVALATFAVGCAQMAPDAGPGRVAPAPAAAEDVATARALIAEGNIQEAIEPLRRAVENTPTSDGRARADVELLLNQCRSAVDERTAEARIADMKKSHFAAFVESGALPREAFFADPAIDAYFRKVLLSKRGQAREIRERITGKPEGNANASTPAANRPK